MANRAAGTEQGARDLPKRRQRGVALERLRERRGALFADLVPPQAAARRGRSVRDAREETGPPSQSWARETYWSVFSVELLFSASESASAPASPSWLHDRLQRGEGSQGCSWRDRAAGTEQGARDLLEYLQRRAALERLRKRRGALGADIVAPQAAARVRDARSETGPPAQSRPRATYSSDVSVALLLSASESFLAPVVWILLNPRLQRGEECQGCSWRNRAAGTEQGARNLLERRQQAQCIHKLVTIPPAFELL